MAMILGCAKPEANRHSSWSCLNGPTRIGCGSESTDETMIFGSIGCGSPSTHTQVHSNQRPDTTGSPAILKTGWQEKVLPNSDLDGGPRVCDDPFVLTGCQHVVSYVVHLNFPCSALPGGESHDKLVKLLRSKGCRAHIEPINSVYPYKYCAHLSSNTKFALLEALRTLCVVSHLKAESLSSSLTCLHSNISTVSWDMKPSVNLMIPAGVVGCLIGSKGATIKEIQQLSNTRIRIRGMPGLDNERLCSMSSTTLDAMLLACDYILSVMFLHSGKSTPGNSEQLRLPEMLDLGKDHYNSASSNRIGKSSKPDRLSESREEPQTRSIRCDDPERIKNSEKSRIDSTRPNHTISPNSFVLPLISPATTASSTPGRRNDRIVRSDRGRFVDKATFEPPFETLGRINSGGWRDVSGVGVTPLDPSLDSWRRDSGDNRFTSALPREHAQQSCPTAMLEGTGNVGSRSVGTTDAPFLPIISEILESYPSLNFFSVVETKVPASLASNIIGAKGRYVREIQAISGGTVNLSREHDNNSSVHTRRLQVIGSSASVYTALAMCLSRYVNTYKRHMNNAQGGPHYKHLLCKTRNNNALLMGTSASTVTSGSNDSSPPDDANDLDLIQALSRMEQNRGNSCGTSGKATRDADYMKIKNRVIEYIKQFPLAENQ